MTETIKVRICVAATSDGKWNSCGASWFNDEENKANAVTFRRFGTPIAISWVEVEIPLPQESQETTLQGKLVE